MPNSMSLFDPDRSAERIPVSPVTAFLGSNALYGLATRSADARRWLNAEAYDDVSSQDQGDVSHEYHASGLHMHRPDGVVARNVRPE